MGLREDFKLYEYSEETINRIISYRMNIFKDKSKWQYFSIQEIAEMENMKEEDVEKILNSTAIVWVH